MAAAAVVYCFALVGLAITPRENVQQCRGHKTGSTKCIVRAIALNQ